MNKFIKNTLKAVIVVTVPVVLVGTALFLLDEINFKKQKNGKKISY